MVVLAQDLETGDLAADESGLVLAYGADAVVVLVTNNLRQQPGEDRRLPTRGLPIRMLLGKGATPSGIRNAIVRQVSTVSGVERVISCEVDDVKPQVPVRLALETAEGPASVVVEVG